MGKQKDSRLMKKFQGPDYESDRSLEIIGVSTPQKKSRGGRVPSLRSHRAVVMSKSKGRSEELLIRAKKPSSILKKNSVETRQSAKGDRRNVPKLPGEELNAQQQKEGNEDLSSQVLNPADVSKHTSSLISDGNGDAKVTGGCARLKLVYTRRTHCLKSAQSDMLHGPRLPPEVEPNHQKQKDGNEDPCFHSTNLNAAPRESSPPDSCKDDWVNGMKSSDQQPVKRKGEFEVLQPSIGLRSPQHAECENVCTVACDKTAIGEPEISNKAGNVKTFQNTELLEYNGKKDEELDCVENRQDSDYESERSLEILDVFSPRKVHCTEGESGNLQPPKRTGRRRPFLRSDGPVSNSVVLETKMKSYKNKYSIE